MVVNTAEFWVFIAFILMLGMSYKYVWPKVANWLDLYRYQIDIGFQCAEDTRALSEKKLELAMMNLKNIDIDFLRFEQEFEHERNLVLERWQESKYRQEKKYQKLLDKALDGLKDTAKVETMSCANNMIKNIGLKCISKQLSAKTNNIIIKSFLEKLN